MGEGEGGGGTTGPLASHELCKSSCLIARSPDCQLLEGDEGDTHEGDRGAQQRVPLGGIVARRDRDSAVRAPMAHRELHGRHRADVEIDHPAPARQQAGQNGLPHHLARRARVPADHDAPAPHPRAERLGEARHALLPGMQLTAEIKLGERTVLEYLLSPIRKVASEAGRER